MISAHSGTKKPTRKSPIIEINKLKIPKKVDYSAEEAKGCKSWFNLTSPVNTFATIQISDKMNENKVLKALGNL